MAIVVNTLADALRDGAALALGLGESVASYRTRLFRAWTQALKDYLEPGGVESVYMPVQPAAVPGHVAVFNATGHAVSSGSATTTPSGHNHSANDITSDVLAVARGGTGTGTAATQHRVIVAGAAGAHTSHAALTCDGTTTTAGALDVTNATTHRGDVQYIDTFWDDLVIPATAVNPPGGVGPASYNTTEATLDFVNGADNRCDFTFQLPHRWKEGTSVYFHLHVLHSTNAAANTRWTLSHRTTSIDGADPGWTTDAAIILATPASTAHTILAIKTQAMSGHKISACLQYQLVRNGGHGDDTYSGDVRMISADVHYEIDRPGSREILAK
jgi:hypothetical protein